METLSIRSASRTDFVDITARVQAVVKRSGVRSGSVVVFVPHTTAGVTINENADPDVVRDLTAAFDRIVPWESGYHHAEGNSAAHAKASLMGSSVHIPIENGGLTLGTWQNIYLCEFDGPRTRTVQVQILRGE